MVLDNARHYRSRPVREFVQANPRLELMSLPACSPNLKVIERLWRLLKTLVAIGGIVLPHGDELMVEVIDQALLR